MRAILQIISAAALISTVLPSCLYLAGRMDLEHVKTVMLVATISWFAATPFWMGRPSEVLVDEGPAAGAPL